eukprot:11737880-Karenia_brevis.AAC.1
MAEGMATKLSRPSKEGLDRRNDANATLGMATKLSSGPGGSGQSQDFRGKNSLVRSSSDDEGMPLSQ